MRGIVAAEGRSKAGMEAGRKLAVEVLEEIADEERVYVGELLRLLRELAPNDEKLYAEGAREVEEKIKKK